MVEGKESLRQGSEVGRDDVSTEGEVRLYGREGMSEGVVVSAAREISGVTFGAGEGYVAGGTVDIASVKFGQGKEFVVSAAREISGITFGEGKGFVQMISATGMRSPIRIERNRISILEDEIETEKPYFIRYGKNKLVIRKREDGKIYVDKLS